MPRDAAPARTLGEAFADRRRSPDTKREAILQTAVRMFLEHGYARTSLNDVADQLKITKPALYHYFRNKEDILLECSRRGVALIEEGLAEAAGRVGTGLEKVSVFIRAYARAILVDFASCVVRVDERELSAEAQAEIRRYKRHVDRKLRSFVQEGLDDGSIAPCDPNIAAFLLGGAVVSISAWYKPQGAMSGESIVTQFVETLTRGLKKL